MSQFIVVLLIVGAVTGLFFGAEVAMKAGIQTLSLWIYIGLAVTLLSPFLEIFRVVRFLFQKGYRLFHRWNKNDVSK